MTDELDELLQSMPGEEATEAEIEAFMEKVMAAPGGQELIRDFAAQFTSGGVYDEILKADEAREARFRLRSKERLTFRVELLGTQPLVWRELSLPADCSYFHLHVAIQDAFGWSGKAEHRFEVWEDGELELTFSLSGEGESDFGEAENQVQSLFQEEVREFLYFYDFKKGWRHRVVVSEGEASDDFTPRLHAGAGHGPPEGCGGVYGFAQFLAGAHPMCDDYEEAVLKEFRSTTPDLSKVTFRDPSRIWSENL